MNIDSVATIFDLKQKSLDTFAKIWYHVFLWALFSSMFVHTAAAVIAFLTLRKHKYGKYFPILVLVMGVLLPITSGIVNSAVIASVHVATSYSMPPLYSLFWGVGQTMLSASIGFTRILATL